MQFIQDFPNLSQSSFLWRNTYSISTKRSRSFQTPMMIKRDFILTLLEIKRICDSRWNVAEKFERGILLVGFLNCWWFLRHCGNIRGIVSNTFPTIIISTAIHKIKIQLPSCARSPICVYFPARVFFLAQQQCINELFISLQNTP